MQDRVIDKLVASAGVLLAVAGWPAVCEAEPGQRAVDLGLSLHLVDALGDSCTRDHDLVSCSPTPPFAGARMSAHLWPVDFLGVGIGAALAKDLDSGESGSDDGITWDPSDLWLWRFTAEIVVDPPLLPAGLWAGLDVGVAVLREVSEFHEGTQIEEASASRVTPLVGLALGWDFWLDEALTLTPELRWQLISVGEPPELRPDVEGHDFGSSTALIELGVRLAALP